MPPPPPEAGVSAGLDEAAANCARLAERLGEHHLGSPRLVEQLVAALLARGHVLLEGAPGLGKTRLVRALAGLLDLRFGRVQCTPDLMPADITGGEVLDAQAPGRFRFVEGPVFCQVFLADEINRATPRTQSALLEAMEEHQVTAGGVSHALPTPFFVAATQNPIELEGTYPLPEAQLDRFLFKLEIGSPNRETLERIFALPDATASSGAAVVGANELLAYQSLTAQMPLPEGMLTRLAEIVRATHPDDPSATEPVREHVRWGASPRAGQAALAGARALALLRGRAHVAPQDLREALPPALRHRILLRYEATAAGVSVDELIEGILARHPVR